METRSIAPSDAVSQFIRRAVELAGGYTKLARTLGSHMQDPPSAGAIRQWDRFGATPRPDALIAMVRAFPDDLSLDEAALAGAKPTLREWQQDVETELARLRDDVEDLQDWRRQVRREDAELGFSEPGTST